VEEFMMSFRLPISILAGSLLVGCTEPDAGSPLSIPDDASHVAGHTLYEVVHLGTLGGGSRGNAINNRGWVAGFSDAAGGAMRRAVLWRDDTPIDLGSLGGENGNSNVPWPGLNNNGMVVGITETGEADDLDQQWSCHPFFAAGTPVGRRCVGFYLDSGEMEALPTLGGRNGFAAAVNNRGQIVGWAETDVLDPTCNLPQQRQFRAVMWEPRRDHMQELRPLPGDSASAATAINEAGRAVGISGDCDVAVGGFTARHAVIWTDATPKQLPTLSGDSWHTPMDINSSGEIAGFSLGADGVRAVFWDRHGEIENLGTLDGDAGSQAFGINARGHVVGTSYGGTNGLRAFIWDGGDMVDLNALVVPGYAGILRDARQISDSGVITGSAEDLETGRIVTFVATPVGMSKGL
jgi:probable HAF family extracellular repeat protein